MKYVRYEHNGQVSYGVLNENTIRRIEGYLFGTHSVTDESLSLSDVKLLAPVEPSKVIGMGINYYDFCQKMNIPEPKFPYIFLKAPTTVCGTGDVIRIPKGDVCNFEAELAAVIKDECSRVSEEDALNHVFGYTICNDMTNRTYLLRDNHMGIAKNFDSFLPLGPFIETEMDWENISIRLSLNGETKIDGNTDNMIFKLPYQISFLSSIMTLKPGDIILTGSPAGVSPVTEGDLVRIEIDGLGALENPVEFR